MSLLYSVLTTSRRGYFIAKSFTEQEEKNESHEYYITTYFQFSN